MLGEIHWTFSCQGYEDNPKQEGLKMGFKNLKALEAMTEHAKISNTPWEILQYYGLATWKTMTHKELELFLLGAITVRINPDFCECSECGNKYVKEVGNDN